jgi:hypothetical protein
MLIEGLGSEGRGGQALLLGLALINTTGLTCSRTRLQGGGKACRMCNIE